MAKIYRVYDPQENEFLLHPQRIKAEAITDADSIATIDGFRGVIEVHEMDENDTTLASAVRVYQRRT